MKVAIVHPGTQYAHHLARELEKNSLLSYFYTGLMFKKQSILLKIVKILAPELFHKIANRIVEVSGERLRKTIFYELKYLLLKRISKIPNEILLHERNKSFQERIPDYIFRNSDIIIGYDTSSWIIAEKAKKFGKLFILDQSIGHPKAKDFFLSPLRSKYPKWDKMQPSKKQAKMIHLEKLEHELADLIVAPSSFVRETLITNEVESLKIVVNPFGTDTKLFKNLKTRDYYNDVMIFLFVGSISPRKGVPDLIECWKKSKPKNAELWIAGYGNIPDELRRELPLHHIKLLGKVKRSSLNTLYNKAHIFIFPSYFEGLAQVQLEAQSCGLPIISTKNAGAEEVVEDGLSGVILEIGNIESIISQINSLIENRNQARHMADYIENHPKDLSWDAYGKRWVSIINNLEVC